MKWWFWRPGRELFTQCCCPSHCRWGRGRTDAKGWGHFLSSQPSRGARCLEDQVKTSMCCHMKCRTTRSYIRICWTDSEVEKTQKDEDIFWLLCPPSRDQTDPDSRHVVRSVRVWLILLVMYSLKVPLSVWSKFRVGFYFVSSWFSTTTTHCSEERETFSLDWCEIINNTRWRKWLYRRLSVVSHNVLWSFTHNRQLFFRLRLKL